MIAMTKAIKRICTTQKGMRTRFSHGEAEAIAIAVACKIVSDNDDQDGQDQIF